MPSALFYRCVTQLTPLRQNCFFRLELHYDHLPAPPPLPPPSPSVRPFQVLYVLTTGDMAEPLVAAVRELYMAQSGTAAGQDGRVVMPPEASAVADAAASAATAATLGLSAEAREAALRAAAVASAATSARAASAVRLLVCVLPALTRDEVLSMLPLIVTWSPALVRRTLSKLVWGPPAPRVAALPPAELLVALHELPVTPARPRKCIMDAIILCIRDVAMPELALDQALQRLVEATPLPELLLRTIMEALTKAPRLQSFVVRLLSRLVQRQVCRRRDPASIVVVGVSPSAKLVWLTCPSHPLCLLPPLPCMLFASRPPHA